MGKILKKHIGTAVFIICVAIFIMVIPANTTAYSITVMNAAIMYYIAALGLSLMQGMGGLMSFAVVSFMGVGAFTTAQLSKNFGVPTVVSVMAGVVMAAITSLGLGMILLRLRGSFFVFGTIALSQIINNIFLNYKPLTGGPDGTSAIPKLDLGPLSPHNLFDWFYILMAVSIVVGIIVENIRRTHLGRALASVRDNEIAAMSLGVNVFFTKLMAFTIAGALAGLSGALLAHHNSFISYSLFSPLLSINYLMMIMLGGVNSTVGTFVGALLVTMLPEWLRPMKQYLMLINGFGVILLMIFMPMGLAGLFSSVVARLKKIFVKEAISDDGSDAVTAE